MNRIDETALAAEWSFQAVDGGYIYYAWPNSKGIRVTKEEREVFLKGVSDEWYSIIDGRDATEPPRPYWPELWKRLRSILRMLN
jgi:hypothetical protein